MADISSIQTLSGTVYDIKDTVARSGLNDKAPKDSPVFTSSLSLGRKSNTIVGTNSLAIGFNCEASGTYTQAQGEGTVAMRRNAHVFGAYNYADAYNIDYSLKGKYIEIVGNGTSIDNRTNARTLDWDGNERIAGDLYVGASWDGTGGTKVIKQGCTWGDLLGS